MVEIRAKISDYEVRDVSLRGKKVKAEAHES